MMHCSSVLEFYISYLTCSVSPDTPSNYGVELWRSPDPLLECSFSSTHQSPCAHYLWSLDDIAQFCMSNSHFSPIKFSLHDHIAFSQSWFPRAQVQTGLCGRAHASTDGRSWSFVYLIHVGRSPTVSQALYSELVIYRLGFTYSKLAF